MDSVHMSKPQCPAVVDGIDADGEPGTFCCLLREGHRGTHKYHETLTRETGPMRLGPPHRMT